MNTLLNPQNHSTHPATPLAAPSPTPDPTRPGLVFLAECFPPLSLEQVLEQVSQDRLRIMALSLLRGRSARTQEDIRRTELVHLALQRSSGNFHPAKGWNDLEHFNHCFWNALRWTLDDHHATGAHKFRLRTDYLEDLYSADFDLADARDESTGMTILEEFKERDPEGFDLLLNYKGHNFSLGDLVKQGGLMESASDAENPQKAAEKKLGRKLAILQASLRAEGRKRGLKLKSKN